MLYRSNARGDALASVVGVDGPHRFCRACAYRIDELPMEADLQSLVCAGVGSDRLEGTRSPVYRLASTRRDSVIRDTAYISSGRRASHRLPGRRNRLLRSNRGAVSAARATDNGDARLAGNLFARRTASSSAPIPQECA